MNRSMWTWLLVPCLAIGVPACEMEMDEDDPDVVAPAGNGDTNIIETPDLDDGPDLNIQEGPDVDAREAPDINVQDAPDINVQEAPETSGQSGGNQQP